jgi:SAM-dependent methyltransferase
MTKDRARFVQVLGDCVRAGNIGLSCSLLIVGGSIHDARILRAAGFRNITLSNLEDSADAKLRQPDDADWKVLHADAEDMRIPDGSFDLVLAHEVLHHCRSPHKALLEMLRVSRKHVIILEPNDSALMRGLVRARLSFPFELPAVIANSLAWGGVRDTCIPNYIYRWSPRDLYQATASFLPELEFTLYIRRYWDFNVNREELALRSQTRIGAFTRILGPDLFLYALHIFQAVANRLPWLGSQGNKFFGCITKEDRLKPWLVRDGDRIAFNPEYAKRP